MNKTDKFVALRAFLDALGMTRGEFNEFVKSNEMSLAERHYEKTVLPVAYIYDEKIKIRRHLNLNKKDFIWGVEIGGVVWSKDKVDANWLEASERMDVYIAGCKMVSIPDKRSCIKMWESVEEFSQMIDLFHKVGVKADDVEPDDVYWVLNGEQVLLIGRDGKPVEKTDDLKTAKLRLCVFM